MEKLQKALDKARRERQGVSSPPAKDADAAAPRSAGTGSAPKAVFPPVWDRLQKMELDNSLLVSHRVLTMNANPEANPLDVLRTKVWLLMRENGWTRLAITSPDKACGKTMIACNMAIGFSRQQEVRSMLLDLDMRRPSVAAMLGQSPAHDINEVLTGAVAPEDQMLRLRHNVAFSMASKPVEDSTQLLLSRQAAEAFDTIQTRFEPDLMIYDLPPMLVTDDARAILKNVDCALIVARAENTRMARLDVCEREVSEHTNVLGVVLNNCRHVNNTEQYDMY